jgi:glutaredoxin
MTFSSGVDRNGNSDSPSDGSTVPAKGVGITKMKLWHWLVPLLGVTVWILGALLMTTGREFAVEMRFSEINSIAQRELEFDDFAIRALQRKLDEKSAPQQEVESEISVIKSERASYICIDDDARYLFSREQRAVLEKSLRAYYAKVYWGRNEIPAEYRKVPGFFANGSNIVGYRISVYPGVVRIDFYKWRGMIGDGGGRTSYYVWNGAGFRRIDYGRNWTT